MLDNIKEILEKINKVSIFIVLIVLISLFFLVIFNKNYTILVLYFGILITIIISKQIGKLLKFINSKKEYKEFYKDILNSSISNFTKIPGDFVWISPNTYMTVLVFIYFYLYLSHSFSYKLNNNSTKAPNILIFFIVFIVIYFLIHTLLLSIKVFGDVWEKKNAFLWDFILRAGIYNLCFSFLFGLVISFIYFTIIKTFFKKQLFFQTRKKCNKNNVCFYDPIKTNWIYQF